MYVNVNPTRSSYPALSGLTPLLVELRSMDVAKDAIDTLWIRCGLRTALLDLSSSTSLWTLGTSFLYVPLCSWCPKVCAVLSWIRTGGEEELGGHAPNSPSENGEETHLGIFRLPTPGSLHRRRENTAQEEFGFLMGECMWVLWNVQYWLVVRYVLFSTKFGMIMYCTQTLFQLQFFCRVQAAWAELRRRMDLILSRREHLPLVLLNWTGSGLFLRELHRLASYKGADGVGLLLSFVTVCLHYLHILHSCTK